jgi:hypothetical protein
MRSDMYKVIVERPRLIHGNWLRGGREDGFRQCLANEETAHKVSMRTGHRNRKWPNENLAPLRRFLMSCAGRPWNKVRSELLAGIDQRNTVQQHIFTHVEQYVLTDVRAVPRSNGRGTVFEWPGRWGASRWEDVALSYAPLFVDPRTGVLRLTQSEQRRAQTKRDAAAQQAVQRAGELREIDATRQLCCENGLWFEVVLAAIPGPALTAFQRHRLKPEDATHLPKVWDAWQRCFVSQRDADRYATSKRQLNSAEIVRYGLRS